MEKELDRLEKSLSVAIEKVKQWIDDLKQEDGIKSEEYLMLHEIMRDGVTHLTTLTAIMLTLQSEEANNPEFTQAAKSAIKQIKTYVNFIKQEAFNE